MLPFTRLRCINTNLDANDIDAVESPKSSLIPILLRAYEIT